MGYTNVVQVYQSDMSFILQEEISDYTYPFIDDLPIKGVVECYEHPDGTYETILDNLGIRRFIWEHLQNVYHILQHLKVVNITVLAKKFVLATPDATIVGHKCTFEGCIPHNKKVQKIHNWPQCQNITQVCGFLGVCGVICIFIKGFASIARLLVNRTWKGVSFMWEEPQRIVMQRLKDAICLSPALRHLDYTSKCEVILAVDTSKTAVRYILSQEGEDGKRVPNHFRSLTLMDVESRFLQAKLELYGLFRALRAVQIFIFGVADLTVEMDAKYICKRHDQ